MVVLVVEREMLNASHFHILKEREAVSEIHPLHVCFPFFLLVASS